MFQICGLKCMDIIITTHLPMQYFYISGSLSLSFMWVGTLSYYMQFDFKYADYKTIDDRKYSFSLYF